MMKKNRANTICRFLKVDFETFKTLVFKAGLDTTDIRPVTLYDDNETEKIFIAFGKSIYQFFKTSNQKESLKVKSQKIIEYPINSTNAELENEFRLMNSIFYCLNNNQNDLLKGSIEDFQKHSQFQNSIEFKNFKKQVRDNDNKDIYINSFYKLIDYIKDRDCEITDFKNKGVEPEKEIKVESDHTDYERIVMKSFRTGNQDNFGY